MKAKVDRKTITQRMLPRASRTLRLLRTTLYVSLLILTPMRRIRAGCVVGQETLDRRSRSPSCGRSRRERASRGTFDFGGHWTSGAE